jgi:hypothetical protein
MIWLVYVRRASSASLEALTRRLARRHRPPGLIVRLQLVKRAPAITEAGGAAITRQLSFDQRTRHAFPLRCPLECVFHAR